MRLRQAERLGHLGLRPLHEEPLEDDPPLPEIERAGGPGDESAIEALLVERRRPVRCIVVTERRRVRGARERARSSNHRAAVTEMA